MNAPTACTVPGCDAPHAARGMCKTHYNRWRYNTPKDQRPPAPLQRVLADVADDVAWMLDTGETPAGVLRRTRYTTLSDLRAALRRAGRDDLANRLLEEPHR